MSCETRVCLSQKRGRICVCVINGRVSAMGVYNMQKTFLFALEKGVVLLKAGASVLVLFLKGGRVRVREKC